MQMRHGLSGVGAAISDDPIPAGQIPFSGQLAADHQQVTGQGRIAFAQIGERRNFLLGDDQDMHGGLRIDVLERQALLVFVNNLGRNLPVNNPFENRFADRTRPSIKKFFRKPPCSPP